MGVTGRISEPHDDTRVLNAAVGIQELCTDGADMRPHGLTHHFAEPVVVKDFGIVVEQADVAATRFTCREIVHR